MNRKNGTDECARPDSSSHRKKNQEKQNCSDVVQQNIREMVAARFQSINLTIRHVAQGRKRMPKTGVAMSEQPLEPLAGQSSANVRIFVDVMVVVEIDKLVTERLTKN